jgi:hypothetical protein
MSGSRFGFFAAACESNWVQAAGVAAAVGSAAGWASLAAAATGNRLSGDTIRWLQVECNERIFM